MEFLWLMQGAWGGRAQELGGGAHIREGEVTEGV